jgi:hypothetical protein
MLRRTRTTKKLARRIDLQYFAHPHPLRRWRFWLSVTIPVLALGWLLTQQVQGGQKAYSSGPLAQAHAVFTQQCALCHIARTGAFFKEVRDEACLSCHDGPIHHANQRFSPRCSSCHMEHRGVVRLSATTDASCTQCHAQLQTRDGQPHFVAAISGLDRSHPEFSALAKGKPDEGTIRLNHYLHLQPNLIGPDNQRVKMTCDDCHRPWDSESWPYAAVVPSGATAAGADKTINPGAHMSPIRFASHCAACHLLHFDKRFGGDQVPHDKPQAVHAYLVTRFEEYEATHPAVIHEVEPPNRQMPGDARTPRPARNAPEWVQFRTQEAEWLLWTKTCRQCHVLRSNAGGLPEIAPAIIASRWLQHAEFDHRAHRMMSCAACHSRTTESHDTSDILLPGIATCRQCHREGGASTEVAEGRCFECHRYHDWSQARRTKGRFSIPELRGTAKLVSPQDHRVSRDLQ